MPVIALKNPDLSILLLVLTMSIAISSCDHHHQWENERLVLHAQGIELERDHELLDARIDSMWDVTSETLSKEIPEDFPAVDRDIFIHARNADHIRMFMSFQKLDTALQSLVNKAGEEDAVLAGQIRTLLDEQRQYEVRKNQFLQKVGRQDVSASRAYAELFRQSTR